MREPITYSHDATKRFASIAELIRQIPVKTAVVDGEVAVPDERGVTHIYHLNAARDAPERLAFFAFDLLWLNGEDLRRRPMLERKARLAELLRRAPERVVFSDWNGGGRDLFRRVGELGSEGIVSKRADSPYTSGPSSTWLKCKHSSIGTFPVIEYVPHGKRIEALLVPEPWPVGCAR